jgi:type II secretory pathway pseudopilin PulG
MTQRTAAGGGRARRGAAGYTLLEVAIALTLATIVIGLLGSLLIASLGAWRRGQDLRAAQVYATILVDTVARDVRRASRTIGVNVQPASVAADGEAVLTVAAVAVGDPSGESILYVYRRARGEVARQVVTAGVDGQPGTIRERLVAAGVAALAVREAHGSVTVEVEVRRGRATAYARGTSAPQNP